MADGLSSPPARRAIEPVSMTLYDADFQAFADRLGTSFRRYGFAVIADHGLDEAVIEHEGKKLAWTSRCSTAGRRRR